MFHPGERLAQQKAGYADVQAAIYRTMPEQHRLFFAGLHYFWIAAKDVDGYPVAAMLQGEPGFVQARSETLLAVSLAAIHAAPLLPVLQPGMAIGGLGIDFSNRRRNRVNGLVDSIVDGWLLLRVTESFGNCPKYIQRRELQINPPQRQPEVETLSALDADARYLIASADTLLVASAAQRQGELGGVDISHRGGLPGFVQLRNNRLTIPDYSGNRYMNTLGNLLVEPRCALLLMDFQQGAALHIQGRAEILWQGGEGLTERYWQLEITRIWRLRQLLMPAGLAVEYAPSSQQAQGTGNAEG